VGRESVEDFGVALAPGVIDGDAFEAPLLAVADEVAIVAVHEKRVLGAAARTLPRHEVLGQDVGGERGGIVADLDLEIARGVAGIERADERQHGIEDGLAAREHGEIQVQFSSRGPEIEDAIVCQRRRERIGVAMIEAEGVAIESVGDFITVGGKLGEIGAHRWKFRRSGHTT
jgi:hypothetical protein